jgi:hypothetical protein
LKAALVALIGRDALNRSFEGEEMKTRKLGKLEVSELGFGCMNLATNYGPAAPIDEAINVLRHGRSLWPLHK